MTRESRSVGQSETVSRLALSRQALMKRTLRSFLVLGGVALLLGGSWWGALHSPDRNGTPAAFRRVLDWNGAIWGAFYSSGRPVRAGMIPVGKKPRVNGDLGLAGQVDAAKWRLEVIYDDEPNRPNLELSIAAIQALPRVETSAQFRCIEGWSDDISYTGVRFSEFLKFYGLGLHPTSDHRPYKYVGLETPDGEYYVSLDMDSMLHPQTLLAYEMNGAPLSPENGAPLRLIIPVKYGIKSIKRIGTLYFSDQRPPDYWAEQGYDWFAGL